MAILQGALGTGKLDQPATSSTPGTAFTIRPAKEGDVEKVIRLDTQITGVPKPEYWREKFNSYGKKSDDHFFLVACHGATFLGFIIGEVRAWEFGSPPCGWIFTIAVDPDLRLDGVGSGLFNALCQCFRKAGTTKIRTMLARDDLLVMSFFRSQGMMAGPFTELEKDLDE